MKVWLSVTSTPAGENLLAVSLRSVAGKRLSRLHLFGDAAVGARQWLNNNWGYTGQNIELKRGRWRVLHLNCTVTPLRPDIATGRRLLLELQPIDQQLKATREERLIEQQQASRELIRNLAHEIKNPLGGIRGAAQLLEHELANPALKEYTQVIIKEADRLQDLMQRLLRRIARCCRRRSISTKSSNGCAACSRPSFPARCIVPRLRHQPAGTGRRPRATDSGGPQHRAQCGAGDEGRRARSCCARASAAPGDAGQEALPAGARSCKVIDNGPGIPDDIRERMFYPLVSGREGGSGLGLTIAQNFVQHHHGTIDCSSRPGHTVSRSACRSGWPEAVSGLAFA
jgi:two-component system nitrogen regulation sensor histidine kinase GlnL